MNSVPKRVKFHEGGLQAIFSAYKCSPHCGPPIHALTSSQGVSMRWGEDLCNVHFLAISPHSHGRVLHIHFSSKLSSN